MFTRGLVADLVERRWEADLALVDVNEEALTTARTLSEKMIAAREAPVSLSASADRRDVFDGATVVICTIGVGGRRAWEADVFIPRKYGIYQPVGDTVGPGGSSRALRMIPAMVDIARDVQRLCPDALFFNYGNPMAPVCRAIHKATGASITGLCHGVHDVAGYLAGRLGVPRAELDCTAAGMNHLTWFTRVAHKGTDLSCRMRELAESPTDNRFSWELVALFGAFPAAMDRHVIEFYPRMFLREGGYYGQTPGVDAFSFEGTIEMGDRIANEMAEVACSPEPLPTDYFDRIGGEHEQVLDIVEDIRNGAGTVYSANLPNTVQIPNLPRDCVVEAPARAMSEGLVPLPGEPLGPGLAAPLAARMAWVETVVDAALEGSREKFVQALVIDGAASSVAMAREMGGELIEAQRAHLSQF